MLSLHSCATMSGVLRIVRSLSPTRLRTHLECRRWPCMYLAATIQKSRYHPQHQYILEEAFEFHPRTDAKLASHIHIKTNCHEFCFSRTLCPPAAAATATSLATSPSLDLRPRRRRAHIPNIPLVPIRHALRIAKHTRSLALPR